MAPPEYEKCVFVPKVANILREIQEEYDSKLKGTEHNFVLVHPTPSTMLLRRLSETEPQFKRLVSALVGGIGVRAMYAAGLFNTMHMHDAFTDEECCRAYSQLCSTFDGSKMMGDLQKFARDAVTSGETYGWFAVGRDENKADVPFVDLDPVVVYVTPPGEWVARTIANRPLSLTFLFEPGTSMKPVSTVSSMLPRYQSMQTIRDYHLRALHYCSKPNFLASVLGPEESQRGTAASRSQVLDETLVNQSAMNDHLENLIRENVCTRRAPGDSAQKRVQVQNKLHEYVSRLGNEHIDRVRSQEMLQKKVEFLETQLRELRGEVDSFIPLRYDLPEGRKIDGSFLSVRPFDIVALEEAYQSEWYRACTGLDSDGPHWNRQDHRHRRDLDRSSGLLGPQQRYQEIIVNELLAEWAKESGIPLEVTSVKHRNWQVEDLMSMRHILHPSRLVFLLSQALDVPLTHVWLREERGEENPISQSGRELMKSEEGGTEPQRAG